MKAVLEMKKKKKKKNPNNIRMVTLISRNVPLYSLKMTVLHFIPENETNLIVNDIGLSVITKEHSIRS